jgi:hypothetical protein
LIGDDACLLDVAATAMVTRKARWSVHVIGGRRTEFLGFVTAPDQHKALLEAINVFQVPSDWQTRIIVARLKSGWLRWLRGGH